MIDVRQYCRDVEDYLTRANGGHLVRIVGPGFELVRQWAEDGIPLSVVFRGIDLKVDRQRASHAGNGRPAKPARPLRIEFCEADVRDVYAGWRRAVGLPAPVEAASGAGSRRPSLIKHLDRAIDRLARVSGSLQLPESFRETVAGLIEDLGATRDAARAVRGLARAELTARLPELDQRLLAAARAAAGGAALEGLARDAEHDLAPFRGRLPSDAWQHAVEATVDRLLRDRFGLPTLELHA